jgi:hypothetical protein
MLSLMCLATNCSTIPAMLLTHAHNPQSHDHITSVLADLATQHGLPTSIKNVPFADSHSQRHADLVTCRGGLVRPNPRLYFGPSTLLVMDVELGHNFTSSHQFFFGLLPLPPFFLLPSLASWPASSEFFNPAPSLLLVAFLPYLSLPLPPSFLIFPSPPTLLLSLSLSFRNLTR